MHYGRIIFPESPGHSTDNAETVIDEVMAVTFRAPHSYTGEDSAEIYCHGSQYIVSEILRALMAAAGEFTKRAFLNGRMDLAQAEAVADLIASENRAAHDIALKQMRGGYSSELQEMRSQMVDIVSLMELELDFSEEDVEFADRSQVLALLDRVSEHISRLVDSFALGNAIKNGIPTAIAPSASSIPPASATPPRPSRPSASTAPTAPSSAPQSSSSCSTPPDPGHSGNPSRPSPRGLTMSPPLIAESASGHC